MISVSKILEKTMPSLPMSPKFMCPVRVMSVYLTLLEEDIEECKSFLYEITKPMSQGLKSQRLL